MAGSLEEQKKQLEELEKRNAEVMEQFIQLQKEITEERNKPTKYKRIIKVLLIGIGVLGTLMIITLCLFFYLKSKQA